MMSLKRMDCTRGEGRSCNPPCWEPGLGESCVQPQTRGLWKCRCGSTSGSLARLPTCCLCSVQQPLLILPTCAGGAAGLLESLSPEWLFGSCLPQLILSFSSLPQVSRSCLQMWVIWQLFLAAGVTGDNAVTSGKWLPSAGRQHCQL